MSGTKPNSAARDNFGPYLTHSATSEWRLSSTPARTAAGRAPTYESLAREGETMTAAEMATYALRPNRPGPSRAECCLVRDDICATLNWAS